MLANRIASASIKPAPARAPIASLSPVSALAGLALRGLASSPAVLAHPSPEMPSIAASIGQPDASAASYRSFGLVPLVVPAATSRTRTALPTALRDCRVLMIREKRGAHYTFPKGAPEPGDRDGWDTALRELAEEITMKRRGRVVADFDVEQLLGGRTFDEMRWRHGRWYRLSKSLISNKGNDVNTFTPAARSGFYKLNRFFVARLDLPIEDLPDLHFCRHELLDARWVPANEAHGLLTHRETKNMFVGVLEHLEQELNIKDTPADPVVRRRGRRNSLPAGIIATDSKLNVTSLL